MSDEPVEKHGTVDGRVVTADDLNAKSAQAAGEYGAMMIVPNNDKPIITLVGTFDITLLREVLEIHEALQ